MITSRRQFLLSTAGVAVGAIVPSFYFRALEFFEQFDEPLLEVPGRVARDLYAYVNGEEKLELSLGDPSEEPPEMTFREFFAHYQPAEEEYLRQSYNLGEHNLDSEIDWGHVCDHWCLEESPQALAYHYLQSINLGEVLKGTKGVGALDFTEQSNMTMFWYEVHARDEVTLSLLQRRLNDLGTGVRVVPCACPW
jgi:hypothetical protein